jgi:hypothetical protein
VLVGLAAGVAVMALATVEANRLVGWTGRPHASATSTSPQPLYVALVTPCNLALWGPAVLTIVGLVLLLLTRREAVAWPLLVVLNVVGLVSLTASPSPAANGLLIVLAVVHWAALVALLVRFGVLAVGAFDFTRLLPNLLVTADPSAWYFGRGLAGAAVIAGLAAACYYTSTGGGRLFREGFFGDD